MGRLPALALVLGVCAWPNACDKGPSPGPVGRSEQVIAAGPTPANAPSGSILQPPVPSPVHPPPGPKIRTRKLCEGDGNASGRALPKTAALHAEAPGADHLDGLLHATAGHWTWVSFWAAWCGPCKEEIPRLLAWRDRLAEAGTPVRIVFVSLDDDQRQLESFLEAQPAAGLRNSLWLPDGKRRASWFASLHMDSTPELPEHALIDGSGRVRCFIQGAIEDDDYAEISSLVRAG